MGALRLKHLGSIGAFEWRRLLGNLFQKLSNPALTNLPGNEKYVENFAAVDSYVS